MEANLLDRMLSSYLSEQTVVTVTLQNKIRITGKIKAFDSYVIIVDGTKREILYRHAISSLSPALPEEQKRQAAPGRAAPNQQNAASHKARQAHRPALSASAAEPSINNGMKEGLLKWMQEQKAAK